MCDRCGCGQVEHGHGHAHAHEHAHAHATRVVTVERALLERNAAAAAATREWLRARRVLCLDLLGAPGAGKTALLERTVPRLAGQVYAIEGDQATDHDAARLRRAGCPALQINTGAGCHLEAPAVRAALEELDPRPGSVVFVENVGNLVCPALFDLGEQAKLVVTSVTEGEDKPLKYPHAFRAARLVLVSKTDLLPHLECDLALLRRNARAGGAEVLEVSARTGAGLEAWCAWIEGARRASEVGAAG